MLQISKLIKEHLFSWNKHAAPLLRASGSQKGWKNNFHYSCLFTSKINNGNLCLCSLSSIDHLRFICKFHIRFWNFFGVVPVVLLVNWKFTLGFGQVWAFREVVTNKRRAQVPRGFDIGLRGSEKVCQWPASTMSNIEHYGIATLFDIMTETNIKILMRPG